MMSTKTKPNSMTGRVRTARKAHIVKREQNDYVTSANRLLSVAMLISKLWWLLESLPWDKLHHLT